ncbi:MAG: aminoacyl-tRNA hydrolase [Patescibacteria group bacterium]
MKLIIGLGNPGKKYAHTRHNAGFLALDTFAKKRNLLWSHDAKRDADIAKGKLDGTSILLVKPTTFMNLSGNAVRACTSSVKVRMEDILIVHDDMDFPQGRMAFKFGGGHSGHKGLSSVIERLETKDFSRLRIGIGHPPPERTERAEGSATQSTEQWVLETITKETMKAIQRAPDAMENWATNGLAQAMNTWNGSEPVLTHTPK